MILEGTLDPDEQPEELMGVRGVEKIQATSAAFAALRLDGSVVTLVLFSLIQTETREHKTKTVG